jgi:excisionase family DNA binding protein
MSVPSTGLSDWEFGPLAVSPRAAAVMSGCGLTKIYELIASGELESYRDGTARKITTRSIRARIERLLAQAQSSQPERRNGPATEASLASRAARKTAHKGRPTEPPERAIQRRAGPLSPRDQ